MFLLKYNPKLFCIGLNKTGTTSLETVLKRFGYSMGNQVKGELLLEDWYQRDFKKIIKYCKTAEAFQDVPFSLPYTYQALDQSFPSAQFILTVRDDAEQWYESLVRFHSKKFGLKGAIPTKSDLEIVTYRRKGYISDFMSWGYGSPKNDPYNKEMLKKVYENHKLEVINYFKSRPDKLLVINVSRKEDYSKLCEFLGKAVDLSEFPWINKT